MFRQSDNSNLMKAKLSTHPLSGKVGFWRWLISLNDHSVGPKPSGTGGLFYYYSQRRETNDHSNIHPMSRMRQRYLGVRNQPGRAIQLPRLWWTVGSRPYGTPGLSSGIESDWMLSFDNKTLQSINQIMNNQPMSTIKKNVKKDKQPVEELVRFAF